MLDDWFPLPRFYDLKAAPSVPAGSGLSFPSAGARQLELAGRWQHGLLAPEKVDTFKDFMASDCIWLQMWVELPDARSRERMQAFMDGYWAEQRKAGRFERPRNNRLTNVANGCVEQKVVDNDNRVLVGLAFAFLAVCLINTVGLLLAKFLNGAPITGVRRALGASRRQVFMQHLVEVGRGVRQRIAARARACGARAARPAAHVLRGALRPSGGYQELMHFDAGD